MPSISGIMMSISTTSMFGSRLQVPDRVAPVVVRDDDHAAVLEQRRQREDVAHVVVDDHDALALQRLVGRRAAPSARRDALPASSRDRGAGRGSPARAGARASGCPARSVLRARLRQPLSAFGSVVAAVDDDRQAVRAAAPRRLPVRRRRRPAQARSASSTMQSTRLLRIISDAVARSSRGQDPDVVGRRDCRTSSSRRAGSAATTSRFRSGGRA